MSIPNTPDNLHKFILVIGVGLIAYCYLESIKLYDKYNLKIEKQNELVTNTNLLIFENKQNLFIIEERATDLSKKYKIDNPIAKNDDSTITFHQVINGDEANVKISDSISKLFDSYQNIEFKVLIEKERLRLLSKSILDAQDELIERENANNIITVFAILLMFIGFNSLLKQQNRYDELQKIEIAEKGKFHKHCQSCAQTFSSMINYGELENQKKQFAFCSNCFDKGKFKKNLNREDFELIKKEAVEKQNNWFRKKLISQRFENLERWKENKFD